MSNFATFLLYQFMLIIFFMYFKVTLWVITYRTYFRSLCSYYNMSTVTTFPYLNFTLFKHLRSFNILKECTISFFVMLLNLAYCPEFCCKLWEAFLLSCFSKIFIHICPLIILAFCSCRQVFFCITNSC